MRTPNTYLRTFFISFFLKNKVPSLHLPDLVRLYWLRGKELIKKVVIITVVWADKSVIWSKCYSWPEHHTSLSYSIQSLSPYSLGPDSLKLNSSRTTSQEYYWSSSTTVVSLLNLGFHVETHHFKYRSDRDAVPGSWFIFLDIHSPLC